MSAPVDLHAAAAVLDFGYRRAIYTRRFLRSLRAKVLAKISTHGLDIDIDAVRACSTFRQIDDLYTAPIHGFKDADDYWTRASSKPLLKDIRVPTLLLNAQNDPFLPASALPTSERSFRCSDFGVPEFWRSCRFRSRSISGIAQLAAAANGRFFHGFRVRI